VFTLQNASNASKQLRLSASGISTSTTRTLTAPDADTTLVGTDNTGVVKNKTFISGSNSTATAAGTTTLTNADAQVQIFTGSTTQIVKLPTAGIVAGQEFTVINNSSGNVTVQSSGANTIVVLLSGFSATFKAQVDTPTTAENWRAVSASPYTLAGTLALRDPVGSLWFNRQLTYRDSTVTAAGTTTLTASSCEYQAFTGSTTQTVKLPTTSITAGMQFTIINQSTGDVTVQSSGGNTIATLTGASDPSAKVFVALQDSPTTAAHWRAI
jgi:hypothetical protein